MGISGRLLEVTHITQVPVAQLVRWPDYQEAWKCCPLRAQEGQEKCMTGTLKLPTVTRDSKAPFSPRDRFPHDCWV